MTGHVFHPGHDDLHGVTVIVRARDGRTYLGRWHERGKRGVIMHDVAVHDPSSAPVSIDAWLARQERFGVAATEKFLVIPDADVASVRPFSTGL